MAVFNAAKREIDIKIVYYGPALCGKTTNVQCIHKMLAPHQRGDLMSLATKDDRTLFFDFLPIELGDVRGFKTRFHVYTVPGQVYYALTRRAVLTGVDGIVFVADSQKNKLQENIESLNDLNENLKYYKKDLSTVPFIIQYNKRDLDSILPIAELNKTLNTMNIPFYATSALQGTGVVETLTAICKLVLKQMDKASEKKRRPQPAPALKTFESPLPEPPLAVQEARDEEPIIKIFSDGAPPVAPVQQEPIAAPPDEAIGIGIGIGIGSSEGFEASPLEPLRLEETPAAPNTEPEFSIDTSYLPSSLTQPSLTFDEPKLSSDIPSLGLRTEVEDGISNVSCGQPQKVSDTAIKIPITFTIDQLQKECSVTITITFDNCKLT